MEDSITLAELRWMLDAVRERQDKEARFQAALHGAKVPDEEKEDTIARIDREIRAEQLGISEEALHFDELGLDVELIIEEGVNLNTNN